VDSQLKIKNVQRISPASPHSAFTDLRENPFDESCNSLLCCYRQGTNHISSDGYIVICKISTVTNSRIFQRVRLPGWDLRDPKFCFDGRRLFVTAYAKHKHTQTGTVTTKMVSCFSTTGESWSTLKNFGEHGWWLWRLTWHKDTAFGFAYNRRLQRLDLYEGNPSKRVNLLKQGVLSFEKHGAGYPNESHILFDDNDQATAIVRRDADTFSAKLGFSHPPYTRWDWHDLGSYVGGPAMLALTKTHFLVAGRDWNGKALKTKLWLLSMPTITLTPLLTLPSKGDNSYPGIVRQGDTLYISYYSGHRDNETRVYLASISGLNRLLDIIK